MVGVHHHRRELEAPLLVQLPQAHQILIVVVGHAGAVLVHAPAQDGVGQGVAGGGHVPAPVEEGVPRLGRLDGVEHHGQVAAGGVLHAHGDVHAAGGEPVLLVLHGPGPHRLVGEHVV